MIDPAMLNPASFSPQVNGNRTRTSAPNTANQFADHFGSALQLMHGHTRQSRPSQTENHTRSNRGGMNTPGLSRRSSSTTPSTPSVRGQDRPVHSQHGDAVGDDGTYHPAPSRSSSTSTTHDRAPDEKAKQVDTSADDEQDDRSVRSLKQLLAQGTVPLTSATDAQQPSTDANNDSSSVDRIAQDLGEFALTETASDIPITTHQTDVFSTNIQDIPTPTQGSEQIQIGEHSSPLPASEGGEGSVSTPLPSPIGAGDGQTASATPSGSQSNTPIPTTGTVDNHIDALAQGAVTPGTVAVTGHAQPDEHAMLEGADDLVSPSGTTPESPSDGVPGHETPTPPPTAGESQRDVSPADVPSQVSTETPNDGTTADGASSEHGESLPPGQSAQAPRVEQPSTPMLGQAQAPSQVSASSSAPTSAPPQPGPSPIPLPTPTQQIASALGALRRRGDGSYLTEITLNPKELGQVRLQVHVAGVTVNMTANAVDPATRALLDAGLNDLRQALTDAGLEGGQLDVSQGDRQDTPNQTAINYGGGTVEVVDEEDLTLPTTLADYITSTGVNTLA
ncbi:flagellar hook-length control protein FliK [Stomatohabitans albus]|uniref:flagellar hook-length control protein FliK n=1 Tax=Stomatohabitans albus TaxID=3110766 RepID=UPI00300C73E1